jgi:uncharacterized membrane protein
MSFEASVVGGLVGAAFTIIFLAQMLDKQVYGVLKVLMMFVSLILLIVSVSMSAGFMHVQAGKETGSAATSYLTMANTLDMVYVILIYFLIFVLFYFVLVLLWNTFRDTWLSILGKRED